MDIFDRLKRFKKAKESFCSLSVDKRAQIIHFYTGILPDQAAKLTKKEQGKVLFTLFYGRGGEDIVRMLLEIKR